jgi:cytochrome c-type biogenesis protein CcmH
MKFKQLILLFLFALPAFALSVEPRLEDEKMEERARNLFLEVRCLVCNGQVIENSDSEFSFQMRALIRQKILEGKSDDEIKDELSKKFGSDILTSSKTIIPYVIGIIVLLAAVVIFFINKGNQY